MVDRGRSIFINEENQNKCKAFKLNELQHAELQHAELQHAINANRFRTYNEAHDILPIINLAQITVAVLKITRPTMVLITMVNK